MNSSLVLDGLRILVVEDNDDARDLVSFILAAAGASVEATASAADGFEALRSSLPQVLVSDIGMPNEDGYSLMRRIRALQSKEGGDTPAIALSAFARVEDRRRRSRRALQSTLPSP